MNTPVNFILPLPFLSTSFVGVYVFYRRGDGSEGSRPLYMSECSPQASSWSRTAPKPFWLASAATIQGLFGS